MNSPTNGYRHHSPIREKKNGSSVKCVDMRPKGHKHIAQGIALGVYWVFTCALLRAKA